MTNTAAGTANTITGSGSAFTTEFYENDIISVSGASTESNSVRATAKVVKITSDTVMVVNSHLHNTAAISGKSVYNETL